MFFTQDIRSAVKKWFFFFYLHYSVIKVMLRLILLHCTISCWYLMEQQPEDNVEKSRRK